MVDQSRPGSSERIHLSHLDGLRGLAALYVVLVHACGDYRLRIREFPGIIRHIIGLTSFGQSAVAIFIVLSGYCLMMPLVQSNTTFLRGGVGEFVKRRAKRILPTYYAALAVSLLLTAAIPAMNRISHSGWDASLPALHADIIISHLLLLHNFNENWIHKIDSPMWSVATEWQIYFVFALVLLPLWRKFGLAITLVFATIVGFIPHWLFHRSLDSANFEFIGLFAFGMAGAVVSFSQNPKEMDIRNKIPWGALSLISLLPIVYFAKYRWGGSWSNLVISYLVIGVATVCLLIYTTESLMNAAHKPLPLATRFLKAKPCVVLGSFSYSLYLIHAPVLALVTITMRRLQLSFTSSIIPYLVIAVPLSILVAYVFYQAFEKPFLAKRKSKIPVL